MVFVDTLCRVNKNFLMEFIFWRKKNETDIQQQKNESYNESGLKCESYTAKSETTEIVSTMWSKFGHKYACVLL